MHRTTNNKLAGRITITVAEAQELSGLGATTIYELLRKGDLEQVKVGKRTLITVRPLERLLTPGAAPGDAAQLLRLTGAYLRSTRRRLPRTDIPGDQQRCPVLVVPPPRSSAPLLHILRCHLCVRNAPGAAQAPRNPCA